MLNACRCANVSESDLCSSPVSSLGVVSDFVVSSVSDPIWKSSVLLHPIGHRRLSSE